MKFPITYEEDSKFSSRTKAKRKGCDKIITPLERDFLVTGTGRSGTKFTWSLLKKLGLDIGHGEVLSDGTVSWYLCKDSDWYPWHHWDTNKIHTGQRAQHYNFNNTYHQVRHPLKTIASVMKVIMVIDYEWCYENGLLFNANPNDKPLKRAMNYWYGMQSHIYENVWYDWRYKLEDLVSGDIWEEFLERFNIPYEPIIEMKPVNRATGYKKPEPLSWDNLKNEDDYLYDLIRGLSLEFGYED